MQRRSSLAGGHVALRVDEARYFDNALADAILDRVIHNAYRIELAGESLRKRPSSS